MTLRDLAGTSWQGNSELFLDPLGNHAHLSPCTLHVELDGVRYTWAHEGTSHEGRIALDATGGTFTDTFHNPGEMRCEHGGRAGALFDLVGSYAAGDGPRWGWRLLLALRPSNDGEPEALVLQMTNITPWGEDVRAVRMTTHRA